MRPLRLLLRIGGWLLTPFLALAASFFGAVAGASFAPSIHDPYWGVALTLAFGGVAGFTVLFVWMRILRRSPEIRDALHIDSEGLPDVVDHALAAEPDAPAPGATPSPAAPRR
jgi:hypothetical protein